MEMTHLGMGTVMTHTAHGGRSQAALAALHAESERLEKLLSRYQPGSDIAQMNRDAGLRHTAIHAETSAVLSEALRLSAMTDGAFDATIGPLVDLWDYRHATAPPSPQRIRQARLAVNHRDLLLFAESGEAMLRRPGQSLDLGGIGKGFASDAFIRLLAEHGIESAYSNLGGNVSTLGCKPDGSPWRVGIRHPRGEGAICALAVTDLSVVTSGDYERYFTDATGKRYHHILDPRTGYPAQSGLVSVTVVGPSAMTADGFSTALFVAGLERAIALLRQAEPMQAVLIDETLTLYHTAGLLGRLQTAAGVRTKII